MLMTVGRGLATPSLAPRVQNTKRFSLYQSLPSEITFERNSIATTINSVGKLVEVSANQPRFNHDEYGNRLGLMLEPEITNKCENQNVNPTNTNGFTLSGSANGVLSLVDDSTELAAAGLDQICTNGMVYKADNTSGTSGFSIYVDGTVGNLNPHSLSSYIRAPNSTGRVCRLYVGGDQFAIQGSSEWQRHKFENSTPNSTGRKFTFIVDSGKEIYFILNQLEEYPIATSIIPVNGAETTRERDRAYITNIDQYEWFDPNQGYFTTRYNLTEVLNSDSYVAVLHDGSSSDTIGLRLDSSAHVIRAYMRANSGSEFISANQDVHLSEICNIAGIRWNNGDAAMISGGSLAETSISNLPTGINRFEIGARNGGSSPMHGHIQEIEIGSKNLSNSSLGRKLQKNSDLIIAGGGQSLMRGHFDSQASSSDAGKQKHREITGHFLKEKAVVMIDGSTGSSAAVKTSDATNYWWDLSTASIGPAFTTFIQNMSDVGAKPTMLLWAQGEQDSHYIGTATSRENYKLGLETIFSEMRKLYGSIPVFIQRIGRRTSAANIGGVQQVREIQQELIDENDWIFEASEIYDVGLYDHVHLDDAGYTAVAERNSQALLAQQGIISESHIGPTISNALLSGNIITVTLDHDVGNDFTPSSNIEGFHFFDDGIEISISSVSKTNTNTVSIALANTPSGVEKTLYYGYDFLDGVNTANIVRDNSDLAMPLRTAKITVN